jgi:hypothetical protein
MTFECICKRCFAEYAIDQDDIMKGSRWWALCPGCRANNEKPPAEEEIDAGGKQFASLTLSKLY